MASTGLLKCRCLRIMLPLVLALSETVETKYKDIRVRCSRLSLLAVSSIELIRCISCQSSA